MSSSSAAAPPSPQEIQRKLSVHSTAKSKKSPPVTQAHVSGTESDSDSVASPDLASPIQSHSVGSTGGLLSGSSSQPPLGSIAERASRSGEESEEDDEEEEGPWKTADKSQCMEDSVNEGVIKSGYLWKKGERRKTWKKRWFVLRRAHLAYYKTSAEYQLLRLLNLADVHSCTRVVLKKHAYTFGVVTTARTFYLQAQNPDEVEGWVAAIQEAQEMLMMTVTQTSMTTPTAIREEEDMVGRSLTVTPPLTPAVQGQNVTSSDSEDVSPSGQRTYSTSWQNRPTMSESPGRSGVGGGKEGAGKVVVSGYLMKCGSKRHNWRKRWFVLYGEKLVYSASHMDTKPHRQFSVTEILDALEFDLQTHKHGGGIPPPTMSGGGGGGTVEVRQMSYTFKIVTTKRTLLVCAPSEEEEIKWLSAVRAVIARRSGAGVVPGEPGTREGDGGLRHKVRNASMSGPTSDG